MNNTFMKTCNPVKVMALILCVGSLPLICGVTGCSTGDRYKQSTGERIDDHGLSSSVKKALDEDPQYKFSDVNVVTFKGVVQLNGFVNTKEQKNRAGEIAKTVPNVKEIKNNITIKE